MGKLNVRELSLQELVNINGGDGDYTEDYNRGVAAGEVIGGMVKNFLTLAGIWRLVSLL